MRNILINSTSELESIVPNTFNLKDEKFIPQSRNSQEFLYKFFDENFIADLVDIKEDIIQDADVIEAMQAIREQLLIAVANHTIYSLLPKLYSSVTDAGIRTQDTQTHTRAPKWSYEELRKSYRLDAISALENALNIYDRKEDIITAEFEYLEYGNHTFLHSFEQIQKTLPIPVDIITFNEIKRLFTVIEDRNIYPVLPQSFCDTIKKNKTKTKIEKELVQHAARLIFVGSLHQNIPFMGVMIEDGVIKGLLMSDDETLIGQKVDAYQMRNIQVAIEQEFINQQGFFKDYVLKNASAIKDFDKTDYYKNAIGASDLVRNFGNDRSKSSFFF